MNNINWLSMLLSTITPLVFGYVLFNTAVFGRYADDSTIRNGNTLNHIQKIIRIIALLVVSFLLSFFLLNFNNDGINQEGDFDTFKHGAWHGLFLSITVATPILVANGYFSHKPWKTILIHILYWIINLVVMGGILDAMNHWENVIVPGKGGF